MKEVIYGACAKHPNHSMINCPMCELEKYKVKEMTQETMTKEQILWNLIIKDPNYIYDFKDYDEFLNEVKNIHGQRILAAMSDWEQQQLSAERERAGKLVEAVQSFVQASDDFNIGYINRNGEITRCGIAALSVAFNDAEKRLRIALTEYNKP